MGDSAWAHQVHVLLYLGVPKGYVGKQSRGAGDRESGVGVRVGRSADVMLMDAGVEAVVRAQ